MKTFKSIVSALVLCTFVPFSAHAEDVEAPPIYVKPIVESEQQKNVRTVKDLIKQDTLLLSAVESKKRLIEKQAHLFADYDEFKRLRKVLADYLEQLEQREQLLKEHQRQVAFLHEEFGRIYGLLDQVVDIAFAVGQMKKPSPAGNLNQSLDDKKTLLAKQDSLLQDQGREVEALKQELLATKDQLSGAKRKYDDMIREYEERLKNLPQGAANHEITRDLQDKARKAADIEDDLAAQRQKLERINDTLKSKNDELVKLGDSLAEKDKQIAALKEELAKAKQEAATLKDQVAKDDQAFAKIRQGGEEMKKRIKALHERTRLLEELADKHDKHVGLMAEREKLMAEKLAQSSANNARIKELAESIIRDAQEQISLLDKGGVVKPVLPLAGAQITPLSAAQTSVTPLVPVAPVAPAKSIGSLPADNHLAEMEDLRRQIGQLKQAALDAQEEAKRNGVPPAVELAKASVQPEKITSAEIDRLKQDLRRAKDDAAAKENALSDLRRQMDELKRASAEARDEARNKDMSLATVQSKLDDRTKAAEADAARLGQMADDLRKAKDEAQAKDEALRDLRREMDGLKKNASDAQAQLKNKDASLSNLESKLADKEKAAGEQIDQLRRTAEDAKRDAQGRQAELADVRHQIDGLKKAADEAQEELKAKDLSLATIKAKLDEKSRDNEANAKQLADMTDSFKKAQADLQAKQNELDGLNRQIAQLKKQAEEAQEEMKAKDLSLATVQAKLDEKTKQDDALIALLKDQLKKTSDALIALSERLHEIEAKLIAAEHNHDEQISVVQDMLRESREQVIQVESLLNMKDQQLAKVAQTASKPPSAPVSVAAPASAPAVTAANVSVSNPALEAGKARTTHALQTEINNQKALVVKLRKDLDWKDKEIARLKLQMKERKLNVLPDAPVNVGRDKEIARLTGELKQTQKKLLAAEQANNRKRLKEALRDAREQVSTLKSKLKAKHENELQSLPEYVSMSNQVKSLKEGIVELIKNNSSLKKRYDDVTYQLQQTQTALEECQAQLDYPSDLSRPAVRPLADHIDSRKK